MTRDTLRGISFILSIYFLLGACNFGSSQMEGDLNPNVRRLSEMLEEYYKIPEKIRTLKGGGAGEYRFVVWKDPASVKLFYEQNKDEIRRMDRAFLAISENKSPWSDDAEFCRAILHWLLTQLVGDRQIQDNAIEVWNKFVQKGSAMHIEEPTRIAMGDAFVNRQSTILTHSFSYEENIQVVFQAHTAFLLFRMKEYQKAIEANRLIMHMHPNSSYTEHYAREQIQTIREVIEGRIKVPETLPE